MRKSIFMSTLLLCAVAQASETNHWGYSGNHGPENWAQLSAENSQCAGQNQSPVNLTGFIEADLTPIAFNYKVGGNELINNGHTVQLNIASGNTIVVDNTTFNLLQMHFHAPSENHINGESFPLEAHLVHADSKGNLAVVALMFKAGESNANLQAILPNIPTHAGEKVALATAFNVEPLLPSDRDHYRFNGSLTTPPCSEGVRWLVLKQAVTVSSEQLKAFTAALHEPNNRPIQPINARQILQ